MRRALLLYALAGVALTAALVAYGHLLHAPAERTPDPDEDEREMLMGGVDSATVTLRRLYAELQRTLDERYSPTVLAAGWQ